MLRNTLILPADDDALAARLLRDAIDDLDVVLLLVFGDDAVAQRCVGFGDQLANRTTGAYNLRRVVWVRTLGPEVSALLAPSLVGALPRAAVLDFHDRVCEMLPDERAVDPVALELAFLTGQSS